MKTTKNYAVELSYKGRYSTLAQKLWGEGHTVFVDAVSSVGAKIKAVEQKSALYQMQFDLDFLKATIC